MILKVGVRVKADCGHVVKGVVHCAMVERFDIGQVMNEFESWNADLAGRETVKHEGVVRVWTMRNLYFLY